MVLVKPAMACADCSPLAKLAGEPSGLVLKLRSQATVALILLANALMLYSLSVVSMHFL